MNCRKCPVDQPNRKMIFVPKTNYNGLNEQCPHFFMWLLIGLIFSVPANLKIIKK